MEPSHADKVKICIIKVVFSLSIIALAVLKRMERESGYWSRDNKTKINKVSQYRDSNILSN